LREGVIMTQPVQKPALWPRGTLLSSPQHGQRVLVKPSAMKPGTKCLVRYRGVGERSVWLPVDELNIEDDPVTQGNA
jgi:hypothetical protein